MNISTITIKQKSGASKKVLVEIDVNRFERLVADLGFFSKDFLKSLSRAEKDYKEGNIKTTKSLKSLRSK